MAKRKLNQKTKLSIYRWIYTATLTCGSKPWVVVERLILHIKVFEMSFGAYQKGFCGMPKWEEALGQTWHLLGRLYFSVDLAMPWCTPGSGGKWLSGPHYWSYWLCSLDWDKQKKTKTVKKCFTHPWLFQEFWYKANVKKPRMKHVICSYQNHFLKA